MRLLPLSLAALLLSACGGGSPANAPAPRNKMEPLTHAEPVATPGSGAKAEPAANAAIPARAAETPGVAAMSPHRRREYERGYRDCRAGRFDRERQGESYRIGCMAAQDGGQAGR